MNDILKAVLQDLREGKLDFVYKYKKDINDIAYIIYKNSDLNFNQQEDLKDLITIGNITYNNTDRELLPIEDGVYDLLLEKYRLYNPNFQVGSEVLYFDPMEGAIENKPLRNAISIVDESDINKMRNGDFYNSLYIDPSMYINYNDFNSYNTKYTETDISKRLHNTEHNHPELVGTLDKCKFVYNKEAYDRGVLNDSNVKTVERDFFGKHIASGIIDTRSEYYMIFELKYDGISIEADCGRELISARSRGDTGMGVASDMTPILKGYKFPHRTSDEVVGVKFEAIITEYDLPLFNKAKNYEYKNCRSAIVGLFASSDAYKYRDFITLVPLAVEDKVYRTICESDRYKEIQYLNREFVSKGCPIRWDIMKGNVSQLLQGLKKFTNEAEFARHYIPFMYDGVVASYSDKFIREKLGRENFINKYSIAVKFNALKKETIFRGYTYTVGQDGSITPMIHYDPVEFYGTIHDKSTGHSHARFMELSLRDGDILSIEYVNDVMPYVSKPDNEYNRNNPNPIIQFPNKCPICGSDIFISNSGKSAKCTNENCGGRKTARLVNMCSKLNMTGFGEATITQLDIDGFADMVMMINSPDSDKILSDKGFGPVEILNLKSEINNIINNPILDTVFLGCLGFDNVSTKTWRLILEKMTINDLVTMLDTLDGGMFKNVASMIKGIGPSTIDTIIDEYPYFRNDIIFGMTNLSIQHYQPISGKKIRATGFRDKEFFEYLRSLGFDADDNGSLTKDTDILLVPIEGHTSSKTQKAQSYGIQIIPVNEFRENIQLYM